MRFARMRQTALAFFALVAVAMAGCTGQRSDLGGSIMHVTSSAFVSGAAMPVEFASPPVRGGENVSPPLSWSGEPSSTKSFAISIVDRHPIAREWVHWVVISVPPGVTTLEAGASGRSMPQGAVELAGTSGAIGYSGPVPPTGSGPHDYEITVYALDVARPDVPNKPTARQFEEALDGHVLASGSITGTFEQP